MSRLQLIVAIGTGGAIGVRGGLPWRLPEDLKRFKRLTTGHAIVMGRNTFESIGKPLPNRRNIVVSRSLAPSEGIEVAATFDEALALARATDDAPFVIGGAGVYAAALPQSTDLHVTRVDAPVVEDADTFFPPFDESLFDQVETDRAATPGLRFIHYRRRENASI
jgi:dihydrofolate reductase